MRAASAPSQFGTDGNINLPLGWWRNESTTPSVLTRVLMEQRPSQGAQAGLQAPEEEQAPYRQRVGVEGCSRPLADSALIGKASADLEGNTSQGGTGQAPVEDAALAAIKADLDWGFYLKPLPRAIRNTPPPHPPKRGGRTGASI